MNTNRTRHTVTAADRLLPALLGLLVAVAVVVGILAGAAEVSAFLDDLAAATGGQ